MNTHGDWGAGFLAGVVLTTFVLTASFVFIRDRSREECDKKLPRTEKCVQVWVPEARSKP